MNAHLMLSALYKLELNRLLSAHPDLSCVIYQEGEDFGCGISHLDSAGTVHLIHCYSGNPDKAFFLACATLGMNFQIW